MALPPVRALVGPTASGKSRVALDVAERLQAEVVAVDAFTVYRGMDVGTAKPTLADRERVPHHMIDVLEPTQDCSVEWFQRAARAAVADVRARGRTPLLVGGSGLYFRAVVDDLEFPPTDPAVRDRVMARVRSDAARAHAELAQRDPEAAARIDPGNLRRSVRALEVLDLTGRPFSDWRRAWTAYRSCYPSLRPVGIDIDRRALDERIRQRTRRMVAGGLLEEARRLAAMPLSATARAAIGYGEALAVVEGQSEMTSGDDLIEAIRVRTRRFAIRQQRWFRSDPRIRWAAADAAAEELMTSWTS